VAQQAAVGARGVSPVGRPLDTLAVYGGETCCRRQPVTSEFSLGASPPIRASIEIDADDFCEQN
jgi:hypothetical protein